MIQSSDDLISKRDTAATHLRLAQIGLIATIILAFSPVFHADFSRWDDDYNIADNPRLNPPTWSSVGYYWAHTAFDLYIPMTYTVWAGLARISYVAQPDIDGWHLNPYVFHTVNVLAHIGSALLAFSILRKLLPRSLFAAWAGAMLFALHPVQVDSVAWIAGFKDVLAGMFGLLTLRFYLEDGSGNRQRWCFAFATIALVIAMLSKPIAMIVPVMAAAIDWILARRSTRQILIRFAMWVPLAIACAIIARFAQPPKYPDQIIPFVQRPLIAGDALMFYLWKLIWPISLGVDYGRSPANLLAAHIPYLTTAIAILLAIAIYLIGRRFKLIHAGAAIFVIALLPILGMVPFDFQRYSTVADHYLYLPMLGIGLAVASIVATLHRRSTTIVTLIILMLLGVRTFLQSRVWDNPYSLFSHAVQVNPQSWVSRENLSLALVSQRDFAGAKSQVLRAIELNPTFQDAQVNLSYVLYLSGDLAGAIAAERKAVEMNPNDWECWAGLGHELTDAGQRAQAVDAYRKAQHLNPSDPKMSVNLASALADNGELDEAIERYHAALRMNSAIPEAQQGLKRAEDVLAAKSAATRDSK